MKKLNQKVFVGMSGGVDSSVAALLLQKQGYDVVGVYMKCWDGLPTPDGVKFRDQCTWKQDRRDAIEVAAKLKIPFKTYDFTKEYRRDVIEYFFKEAKAGRTPNPDVMCNRYIKFSLFLKQARKDGADFIATGHYVKKSKDSLYQANDTTKDQSYFLWTLSKEQIGYSLFPIGSLKKTRVRQIAKKAGLVTASKKDSQGICFIGNVGMVDFLGVRIKHKPGPVITSAGKVVGEHFGLPFYTIGQRHSLNIPSKWPYYVADKITKSNTLVVGEGQNDECLFGNGLIVDDCFWPNSSPIKNKLYKAKIRYRQPDQGVKLVQVNGKTSEFKFTKPQRAITPGQSLVLYDGKKMLGGGIIRSKLI